jgi:beta-glucosidase
LTVRAADLKVLGLDLKPVFEPGEVEVLVGPNADRSQLLAGAIRQRV